MPGRPLQRFLDGEQVTFVTMPVHEYAWSELTVTNRSIDVAGKALSNVTQRQNTI